MEVSVWAMCQRGERELARYCNYKAESSGEGGDIKIDG
jgi:hypothetical protein